MENRAATATTLAEVVTRAAAVLETNWQGSYTVPATGLYPHQWSWDSAFIAMGLSRFQPGRSARELETLLNAQWSDGRIPQIVFDVSRDSDYSPGASFWRSSTIPGAPRGSETAGLVQPPVHAWAAWLVYSADPRPESRQFLERVYPKLVAWHRYLEHRRDRGGNGLASIVHPWESGTDNSPLWDEGLASVPSTPRTRILRPDLQHADSSERPSNREYGKYFWLAERYRDHDCDDVDPEYPFLFEDPMFNALWAKSEAALAKIAAELGVDQTGHERRSARLLDALAELFDSELGCYVARETGSGTLVKKATINGLIPLVVPGIHHGERLLETVLGSRFLGGGALMVPGYDLTATDLDPALYWRGPAWFNMNWMLVGALDDAGQTRTAEALKAEFLRLAVENDFPEYVNPWTGEAHGTRDFSWTAALTLDLALSGDRR